MKISVNINKAIGCFCFVLNRALQEDTFYIVLELFILVAWGKESEFLFWTSFMIKLKNEMIV